MPTGFSTRPDDLYQDRWPGSTTGSSLHQKKRGYETHTSACLKSHDNCIISYIKHMTSYLVWSSSCFILVLYDFIHLHFLGGVSDFDV